MLGLLYVVVLGLQVALPEGHPLRGEHRRIGRALAACWAARWCLVLVYREGLSRLQGAGGGDATGRPRRR